MANSENMLKYVLKHLILKWAQLVKLKSHELLNFIQRHIKPCGDIYMICKYRSTEFYVLGSEIDISVSKLLGFETFAKSLRVSVSENLVSEKKSRFRFRKNLVSEKSLGFGKFGLGKEKIQITKTVLVVMSQIWDLVLIGTKALKWSQISPSSARKSEISFPKMLRSLGFGLGLETFAKFLRVLVSVPDNLVSEQKSRFRFRKIWSREKSICFGFGKKSRFRFRKIWYRKKCLGIGFGQNFGIVIQ